MSSSDHVCDVRTQESIVAGVALLLPKANATLASGDDVRSCVEPSADGSAYQALYTLFVVLTPPDTVKYAGALAIPGHATAKAAGGMGDGVTVGVGVAAGERVLASAMHSVPIATKRRSSAEAAGGRRQGSGAIPAAPRTAGTPSHRAAQGNKKKTKKKSFGFTTGRNATTWVGAEVRR